jgi:hypothetical protein
MLEAKRPASRLVEPEAEGVIGDDLPATSAGRGTAPTAS